MPSSPNHYKLLKVRPDADHAIIRMAYRFHAAMYHPSNSETANPEMFRLFQDAWAVLSDASRRAAYDLELGKGIEIEPTLNTQEIYRLLHLDPTADEVIVSVAYKILTARYGPDNADTEDPEMFEKLVNAWRSYRYGDS